MAYRFVAPSVQYVKFSPGPLSGYVSGPITISTLIKLSFLSQTGAPFGIFNASNAVTGSLGNRSDTTPQFFSGAGTAIYNGWGFDSTAKWYLYHVTWAGGAALPRFHLHDETTWKHNDRNSGTGATNMTIDPAWHLRVGSGQGFWYGDIVCVGVKKSNSTDLQIQSISRTSFQNWIDFGFDWLIGLDAIGARSNVMGTGGDETARGGTPTPTLVSDPPSWVWPAVAPAFVPQVIII